MKNPGIAKMREWMMAHAQSHNECGEINATLLAEDWANNSGVLIMTTEIEGALSDENHIMWQIAEDVAYQVEQKVAMDTTMEGGMHEEYPCAFCGWIDGEHDSGCPYDDLMRMCHEI